jgi:glycosyltransferase involved in cell wall biosynthesis
MHILWLKTELLHPVDKGGRIRTYQMLRSLVRDHRVTYLTLDDGNAAPDAMARAREYSTEVVRVPFGITPRGTAKFYGELLRNVASPLPYSLARYQVAEFRRQAERLAARPDVDVVVCDFLTPAVNLPTALPKPVVLFQHNVEAEIWRRHAEVATNAVSKAYFREQWRRTVAFERDACRRFDHVVAVSENDREHFAREYGVSDASAVATGVDTAFFRRTGRETRRPLNMVFTGAMDWMPNEDGIHFFAERVLPLVRQRVPEATLTVVGRNANARLHALATPASGIEITGSVPDVRPYVERADLFVVPLRIGGGTRLKIYEAMAMECPVVSTTIGAEGLPVRDGEHLVLADDAEAFADACVRLLLDREAAVALGRRSAEYVREHFSWDTVSADFARTCALTAERRNAVAA